MFPDSPTARFEAGLGRRTARLTPSVANSLATLLAGVSLVAVALVALDRLDQRPWYATVLLAAVGTAGLLAAAAGVIETLPGPGRLHFHERGFVHVLRDGQADVYPYGTDEPLTLEGALGTAEPASFTGR